MCRNTARLIGPASIQPTLRFAPGSVPWSWREHRAPNAHRPHSLCRGLSGRQGPQLSHQQFSWQPARPASAALLRCTLRALRPPPQPTGRACIVAAGDPQSFPARADNVNGASGAPRLPRMRQAGSRRVCVDSSHQAPASAASQRARRRSVFIHAPSLLHRFASPASWRPGARNPQRCPPRQSR